RACRRQTHPDQRVRQWGTGPARVRAREYMRDLRRREVARQRAGSGRNFTHIGVGTSRVLPVGVRRPLCWSMRKTTIVSESWLAARRNLPVGSMPKWRGVLPWVGTWATSDTLPRVWLTLKTAMVFA